MCFSCSENGCVERRGQVNECDKLHFLDKFQNRGRKPGPVQRHKPNAMETANRGDVIDGDDHPRLEPSFLNGDDVIGDGEVNEFCNMLRLLLMYKLNLGFTLPIIFQGTDIRNEVHELSAFHYLQEESADVFRIA